MSNDLHDQIMNLPCKRTMSHFATKADLIHYKEGHRDARHAAAELALATPPVASGALPELPECLETVDVHVQDEGGIPSWTHMETFKTWADYYTGDQMRAYGQSCAAAAAPNAALVAALEDAASALEDVEADRFNVDMDAVSMAASSARAAPSLEAQPAGEVIPSEKLCALLPGTYYMDPPDGGSVTVLEQIERMAKDAARYRWLIAQTPCNIAVMLECSIGEINDEIDAAMAQGEKHE